MIRGTQLLVLVVMFALVSLCEVRAEDAKPIEAGKAEEFKATAYDLKEKADVSISLAFPAGKKAVITEKGDKKTDVHLFVYDAGKTIVAKDDSPGPDCNVDFTPKEGGTFNIVISNLGPGDNHVNLSIEIAK